MVDNSQTQNYIHYDDETLMMIFKTTLSSHAFDILAKRYEKRGFAVCCQYLRDKNHIQDSLQETFVKIIKNRKQYNEKYPFSSWFYRILKNVCIDYIRKEKRRSEIMVSYAQSIDLNNSLTDITLEKKMLLRLPPKDRQILCLRIAYNLSFPDIAEIVGCSVDAAKKRGQRGLKKLRELVVGKS